jgi:hypothetical protein
MTQSVKMMRWRSSGILKQLAKAESMVRAGRGGAVED